MQTIQQPPVTAATTPGKHVCMGVCRRRGHASAEQTPVSAACTTEKQACAKPRRHWPVITLGVY